ncbi:ABC transporter ATP-binding protein [Microbacterium sp.]|uniref:ABC transporter ATP-binding protein n=1 Tax=Microbacterium sp. TaxID=51671 RepID=UPI002CB510F5|nr:ATP-binding cassette domain-containing protein [Microbacterium sp.]HWK78637.1 ATP-binding cassette domain-containing protein [Microbacterium sp.]
MPDGQLIEFDRATKRFGAVAAVSDFSARIGPGVVTGFLGPNGAGKTTTLRMLLGLERPTSGTATIGGSRYAELRSPSRVIGAMLDDPAFRGRRTVERHLITAAKAGGVPLSRVGELISFVGLGDEVESRIAALSLGMRQRLSAATALIGDPGVLVLDEPANGLDPEGIRWMRTLIRGLADEGRTVLVSSHVLSEVEQIADEILVISRGELKFAGTMEALADPRTGPVVVDALDRDALSESLTDAGYEYEILRSGLTVRGSDAATIGRITAHAGVALTTLQQRGPTLEDVFLDLVNDRYVAPSAPAPDETDTLFTLAAESEDAADPERLRLDSLNDPEVNADDSSTRDVERADGETKRVERAERVETSPEASDAVEESDTVEESAPVDDRPLPGLAGLAAVASMFATPVTDPNSAAAAVESVDAETSEEDDTADEHAADASDEAHDESEPVAEDDATRVIDIVPTFEPDSGSEPESDIDHPADEESTDEESAGEGEHATDDESERN